MGSVLIGVPTSRGHIEPDHYMSMVAMRNDLQWHKIPHQITNVDCTVVSTGRNKLAELCSYDYMMFIDSDIKFPPYGVRRLMSRDKDIIGGIYYHKDKEAKPTVYSINENGFFSYMKFPLDKIFACDGIGAGFLLIKRKVLEAFTKEKCLEIGYPFNFGQVPLHKEIEEGEDLAFCRRARGLGFEVWGDPTIPLDHIGIKAFNRQDYQENCSYMQWLYEKNQYSNDIQGWMTKIELNWLLNTAKEFETIVEVGSWKGRSTHALATGCPGVVHAIDTWMGSKAEIDGPHKEATEHDIFVDFKKNMEPFTNVIPHRTTSVVGSMEFADKSIDMVFIDAGHTYEEVKEDILAWLPKAKKLICGHDYNAYTVQEAVTEVLGDVDTVDSIWVKRL